MNGWNSVYNSGRRQGFQNTQEPPGASRPVFYEPAAAQGRNQGCGGCGGCGCGGCGNCSCWVVGPTGPTGPAPLLSAAYSETGADTVVATGANIPLTQTRVIGTGVAIDATDSTVTIAQDGDYLFIWNVLGHTATVGDSIVVTLETTDAQTVYAHSGAENQDTTYGTAVSGSTVVSLAAGDTLALRYQGTPNLQLDPVTGTDAEAYTVSLTVVGL